MVGAGMDDDGGVVMLELRRDVDVELRYCEDTEALVCVGLPVDSVDVIETDVDGVPDDTKDVGNVPENDVAEVADKATQPQMLSASLGQGKDPLVPSIAVLPVASHSSWSKQTQPWVSYGGAQVCCAVARDAYNEATSRRANVFILRARKVGP